METQELEFTEAYQKAAEWFQTLPVKVLSSVAKGEVNAKELAMALLEDQGFDINGKWNRK